MRDFTITTYQALLDALQAQGYTFQTFQQFLQQPAKRVILLRHDVDDRKAHALAFAKLQYERGIVGTYYFRMVPQSFDKQTIKSIYQLGHEIGYHYEDMDFTNGDPHRAIDLFSQHLAQLRQLVPVSTICMHGSPRSKYDNKDVWKYYNYRDYNIIGEPYFDIDFNQVFYLTDTGRRWDGHRVSVRDKVQCACNLTFHATPEIIQCINNNNFPDQVMINFHPQRWTDNSNLWIREKYTQELKNILKYYLIKFRQTG
ncbi:MAG: hypothetical protein ACK4TA_08415 [Saprospiraceae bacterium]